MRKPVVQVDGSVPNVDIYLERGRNGMLWANDNRRGWARVFQRDEGAVFFGLSEYLAAVEQMVDAIAPHLRNQVIIHSKPEGVVLRGARDTALTIEGPVQVITMFETFSKWLHLGTHFRTNASLFNQAAPDKVMFFGGRYISDQTLAIAAAAMAEERMAGSVPKYGLALGTMSHAQGIAAISASSLNGYFETKTEHILQGLTDAAVRFHYGNPTVPVVILIDHLPRSLGCPETAVRAVKAVESLGIKVSGIRIDLGKNDLSGQALVDKSLWGWDKFLGRGEESGVNPTLIKNTRRALDNASLKEVKIVVSSGITLDKVREWERKHLPIDYYGVGEGLIAYRWMKRIFTFDLSAIADEHDNLVPAAKEGRELRRIYSAAQLAKLRGNHGCRISGDLVRVF